MPIAVEHPVAPVRAPGPIRAYAGWAAWRDTTADGGRWVIRVRAPDGTVTTRPERARVEGEESDSAVEDPQGRALPFDLGPDAEGRPSIVISLCDRAGDACRLRIGRLPGRPSRAIAGTTQKRVAPAVPALWGDRVAWVDRRHGLRIRLQPGRRPRRSTRFGPSITDLDLRGDRLAVATRPSRISRLWLVQRSRRWAGIGEGRRELLARVAAGESGQSILAPQFADGGTLMWLTACLGDPGGCRHGFGLFRRDLQRHVTEGFADTHGHQGWAPLAADEVLVGPADCSPETTLPEECAIRDRRLPPG
jgi:hypothetical protein